MKTLSVFTALLSTPKPNSDPNRHTEQFKYMVGKGEKQNIKVRSSKLTTWDIWFSFL
jgi:hypothetical protein